MDNQALEAENEALRRVVWALRNDLAGLKHLCNYRTNTSLDGKGHWCDYRSALQAIHDRIATRMKMIGKEMDPINISRAMDLGPAPRIIPDNKPPGLLERAINALRK